MVPAGGGTDHLQTRLEQTEIDLVVEALETGDRQTREQALAKIETATTRRRRPGRFKGRLLVGDDFFEPLSPEVLQDFDRA
jgi:hypothetical protein